MRNAASALITCGYILSGIIRLFVRLGLLTSQLGTSQMPASMPAPEALRFCINCRTLVAPTAVVAKFAMLMVVGSVMVLLGIQASSGIPIRASLGWRVARLYCPIASLIGSVAPPYFPLAKFPPSAPMVCCVWLWLTETVAARQRRCSNRSMAARDRWCKNMGCPAPEHHAVQQPQSPSAAPPVHRDIVPSCDVAVNLILAI